MKILDLTAGNRAVWYDKKNPLCTFLDKREKVKPDFICDIRNIPKEVGYGFDLVVFDPPHMNCGPKSNMSKSYGYHTTADILDTVEKGSQEAWRLTKQNALMAFKWNNHDIRLERVFDLMKNWKPLFGHLTKDGPRSQTYWVMLLRLDS